MFQQHNKSTNSLKTSKKGPHNNPKVSPTSVQIHEKTIQIVAQKSVQHPSKFIKEKKKI